MSLRPVPPLLQRRTELNEQLASLTAALQKERAKHRKAAQAWKLSPRVTHTTLIIYSLSGYVADPAVTFLANCGRQRHWAPKEHGWLRRLVEDVFSQADADHIATLVDLDNPADVDALRDALSYVEQWRLAEWGKTLNNQQGVAPSTDAVLTRLFANHQRLPEAVRPRDVGDVGKGSARKWAQRWRRRWGAYYGSIGTRQEIPVDEMRAKA